ncbi:MAG: ATP cone domain-containing protein, partial [Sulfurimonas sp.]|nr:ATP cone domain-containing protein [Sulfurimonas sp.]
MNFLILKRDGTQENFYSYKIEDAIKKAYESVNELYDEDVFLNTIEYISKLEKV